jgi:hypothetical protein
MPRALSTNEKTIRILVSMPESFHRLLQQEAEKQDRSISWLLRDCARKQICTDPSERSVPQR